MNDIEDDDPVVREVRERAMRISERFGHDPQRYFEHIEQLQKQHPERVVSQITVVRSTADPKPANDIAE